MKFKLNIVNNNLVGDKMSDIDYIFLFNPDTILLGLSKINRVKLTRYERIQLFDEYTELLTSTGNIILKNKKDHNRIIRLVNNDYYWDNSLSNINPYEYNICLIKCKKFGFIHYEIFNYLNREVDKRNMQFKKLLYEK